MSSLLGEPGFTWVILPLLDSATHPSFTDKPLASYPYIVAQGWCESPVRPCLRGELLAGQSPFNAMRQNSAPCTPHLPYQGHTWLSLWL